MTSTGLLALIVAAASGSATPDGGAPRDAAAALVVPSPARPQAPLEGPSQGTKPPPETKPPAQQTKPPEVQRPRNRQIPPPYSDRTTSPLLDSARSTIEPDREALPNDLQNLPLAPYGPAPPEVTPTREGDGRKGGGPRRVQEIHAPPPAAHPPGATPTAPTPPAASAPDPRRTP